MSNLLGTTIVHGPIYTATFRHSTAFGARPYVHALVHGPRVKGDISYNRLRGVARSEARDVYAPKIIDKGESRPYADVLWDLEVAVGDYWDSQPPGTPRPLVLDGLWSFESFLRFVFARGYLSDPEHAPTIDLTEQNAGQAAQAAQGAQAAQAGQGAQAVADHALVAEAQAAQVVLNQAQADQFVVDQAQAAQYLDDQAQAAQAAQFLIVQGQDDQFRAAQVQAAMAQDVLDQAGRAFPGDHLDAELNHLDDYLGELGNEGQYQDDGRYRHSFSPSPSPPGERPGPFSPSPSPPRRPDQPIYSPISGPEVVVAGAEGVQPRAVDETLIDVTVALIEEEVAASV